MRAINFPFRFHSIISSFFSKKKRATAWDLIRTNVRCSAYTVSHSTNGQLMCAEFPINNKSQRDCYYVEIKVQSKRVKNDSVPLDIVSMYMRFIASARNPSAAITKSKAQLVCVQWHIWCFRTSIFSNMLDDNCVSIVYLDKLVFFCLANV